MSYKAAEPIRLTRSSLGHATRSKISGVALLEICKIEKPYMSKITINENNDEVWYVEKQHWLKNKDMYTDLGFLPDQAYNYGKKIFQMEESFKSH